MALDESPDLISQKPQVFALVSEDERCADVLGFAQELALSMEAAWEALCIETPGSEHRASSERIGEALALAARLGATVSRIPGATVVDALEQHVSGMAEPHFVLAVRPRSILARFRRSTLIEQLAARQPRLRFHALPGNRKTRRPWVLAENSSAKSYVLAVLAVLATAALAALVSRFSGTNNLSTLFLFPVVTASARLGLKPALLAAALSTLLFNFLFLEPVYVLTPWAAQSWIMGAGLILVAVYTSWLTWTLRRRLVLSDRSAHESAALAAFAQTLARVADWESTAKAVCRRVQEMLDVSAVLVREVNGRLAIVASEPEGAAIDPLDAAALDWAWDNGVTTGSGTAMLPDSNWQFLPLKTSLGSLAVLGIVRMDGRNPVPPERAVLLATIIAQAAIALERLHLEGGIASKPG